MTSSQSEPSKVERSDDEHARLTYGFFAHWFEWLRSPIRRQDQLDLTGLPESGSAILHRLGQRDVMTTTELARSMSLNQSTISRQLQPLRELGLIEQTNDPDDRRVTRITLSQKGEQVNQAVSDYWLDYWSRVICDLSDAEKNQLVHLLGRLKAGMDAQDLE